MNPKTEEWDRFEFLEEGKTPIVKLAGELQKIKIPYKPILSSKKEPYYSKKMQYFDEAKNRWEYIPSTRVLLNE